MSRRRELLCTGPHSASKFLDMINDLAQAPHGSVQWRAILTSSRVATGVALCPPSLLCSVRIIAAVPRTTRFSGWEWGRIPRGEDGTREWGSLP
ncbi:hypothetical protein R1flu_018984 [Riccia fluitans]|uniref:Uncharacterized protein n=1 Tax=Riccia fluitans TaxID=41844 RepID=A0ABD1ZJM0_9MARC